MQKKTIHDARWDSQKKLKSRGITLAKKFPTSFFPGKNRDYTRAAKYITLTTIIAMYTSRDPTAESIDSSVDGCKPSLLIMLKLPGNSAKNTVCQLPLKLYSYLTPIYSLD